MPALQRRNKREEAECKRIAALPPYAWIVEPIFPDIIKEYIVSYAINERDIERFARLARANSVLGLAHFITLALEDWPDNRKLQKLAITPPAEVLNYLLYGIAARSAGGEGPASCRRRSAAERTVFL